MTGIGEALRGIGLAGVIAACAVPALAADASPARFSAGRPGGELPGGWREQGLPGADVRPNRIVLAADETGATVARIESDASTGSLAHPLDADLSRTPWLHWRWKADRVVSRGDLAAKDGDDFAARLYVLFDEPPAGQGLGARLGLGLARTLYGSDLPAAAICYVWDNRHPVGTRAWNPYTERVRMVVVSSGAPGAWRSLARDVAADFREAFGSAPPPVSGIAISVDTDNTGEAVTTEFGDIRFAASR